jgi:hypothetical protein
MTAVPGQPGEKVQETLFQSVSGYGGHGGASCHPKLCRRLRRRISVLSQPGGEKFVRLPAQW